MTREEEIDLALTIERGEKAVVEAILSSPIATEELASFWLDLEGGFLQADQIARPLVADEKHERQKAEELANLLKRVAELSEPTSSGSRREKSPTPAEIADALAAYRLSSTVTDRILARLDAQGAARGKSARVADAVRRGLAEADAARARFVHANVRLVAWIAKKQIDQGLAIQDLIQEGHLGLLRAIDKFDPRRGIRFATYASFWIRQAVNRALSNQSRSIRLPVHVLDTKRQLHKLLARFQEEHGRAATPVEAAELAGLPLAKVKELMDAPNEPVSLDAPFGPEGDTKLLDFVSDRAATSPVEQISQSRLPGQLRRILGALSPREQQVLKLRFGIDHDEAITLQEIGDRFALSRERVRQIETAALGKLREHARAAELDSYLG